MSDDRFVTTDRGLDQGSFSVAGRDLPLHSAIGVDRRNLAVSLTGETGVRPFYRIGAWRNDDRRVRTVSGDGLIGRVAVIGAIGRELIDRHVDLVEQWPNLRGVAADKVAVSVNLLLRSFGRTRTF